MRLVFSYIAMLGLLAGSATSSNASSAPSPLPAPEGLSPCPPGDPAALAVSGVAAKLGGEILGCFLSGRKLMPPDATKAGADSVENAFAIALRGEIYTIADLDKLLSHVKDQWKEFKPLDGSLKGSYISELNKILTENSSLPTPGVVSIKPILVSIDRPSDKYYRVTSIRTYNLEANGERIKLTKINVDAVVLQRSHLIRLTIQRTLNVPADVMEIQSEMANWARAIAQG